MSGVGGIVSPAGGLPTSTAIACSNCARATPRSVACAARRVELRARLGHVAARRDTLVVPIDGQLQRPLERRDGRIEERLLASRPRSWK